MSSPGFCRLTRTPSRASYVPSCPVCPRPRGISSQQHEKGHPAGHPPHCTNRETEADGKDQLETGQGGSGTPQLRNPAATLWAGLSPLGQAFSAPPSALIPMVSAGIAQRLPNCVPWNPTRQESSATEGLSGRGGLGNMAQSTEPWAWSHDGGMSGCGNSGSGAGTSPKSHHFLSGPCWSPLPHEANLAMSSVSPHEAGAARPWAQSLPHPYSVA